MDQLVKKLNELAGTYSLDSFAWEIPEGCPISITESGVNNYEKNAYLKENLSSTILSDTALDSHYWLIQKWGGIGSFKKNERNDQRIKKFLLELGRKKLTKDSFGCISSLSKVASFVDPDNYVIYDSRVIYSFNWLLFNFTDESLFPQPAGRSVSLAKFDMQTIFRLTGRDVVYRSHKVAFHEYCNLIKELCPLIFGEDSRPYQLEILLFMIAPTWAVKSVEENVNISITTSEI